MKLHCIKDDPLLLKCYTDMKLKPMHNHGKSSPPIDFLSNHDIWCSMWLFDVILL